MNINWKWNEEQAKKKAGNVNKAFVSIKTKARRYEMLREKQ